MTNWESVSDVPWYNNKGSITNVVIEDGVKIIGKSAFYDCDKLTTITIRNRECKIYDDEYTISSTVTIYGYEGSTAQAYAEKYERTFVTLEEELDVEIIASGECGAEGDNLTWTLDTEGTITISGEGAMKNWYRSYDVPWDKYEWLDIANIVIEDGVTSIGKFAFSHCDHLISIFIHDGVMSIGADALPVCSYKICFEKCNIKRNTDKAWLSQYFRLLCVSSYLILN